ncbi:3-methyl-2-oxobutanoate hydroxymethyltransferase [Hyphomonas pacifica]|uniref:3-methyl-2-oxobutanoate hydroxymethyltransferase n=1 Tax=Hyphomonas pacifica TaxID=1280941 RepID=A0A062U132_9PROT|nr:3-methyl-2-oxobutanoate hydroxymethyltransferase [Hyphomonas pacifica]KCZ48703.1 3-methyl-2-oxobutanoate hydroxymethyltransferase [Hyphomonas pacifica]RAN31603.1 3-methyl-2-oxobutanoate hydroxymethyltransferase [Hyphomonas pacifica]RAN33290.1 3-methyl-2-oxobutanoate hydroxymethyltransferase [Hyphomonas pacifica]
MSKQSQTSRKTVKDIAKAKNGTPLVMLTAYDAPMAELMDPHVDMLLVGDSLGMVVHGLPSTVGVTMEMMILHGQAVMRGSEQAFVVVDMPFGSYETSEDQAFLNAVRIMKETGCQAVKIESGAYAAKHIVHLVERGIPVMAHVGLRPQSVNVDGGFRAKGRTKAEREVVLNEARAADWAGAFAIVIEGVTEDLAAEITAAVSCPTIGIGASVSCDGQVLVAQDMLGLFDWAPKFVRHYADLRTDMDKAFAQYAADVRSREFPGKSETYSLRKPAPKQP